MKNEKTTQENNYHDIIEVALDSKYRVRIPTALKGVLNGKKALFGVLGAGIFASDDKETQDIKTPLISINLTNTPIGNHLINLNYESEIPRIMIPDIFNIRSGLTIGKKSIIIVVTNNILEIWKHSDFLDILKKELLDTLR